MTARLTALGTGDAFSAAGRGHSCYLLEDEAGAALIDAGATVMQGLHRAGFPPGRVDAVHLTHLHGDHFAGWPFLLIDAIYPSRRTAPLHVSGPPGTKDRLAALWSVCYPDTAMKALPFEVHFTELRPGESAEICGRRIAAFAAQHQKPPHVALSLRIETQARTLAFTGDTGAHEGLADLARGAELLVAECSELEPRLADPAARKHLSWAELRTILPGLGVPRIWLSHLGADVRARKAAIEAEARSLGVELSVCEDGDRALLPTIRGEGRFTPT